MAIRLKIRDLELIVALHEEGTLTRAARRVGLTEPALSKRLQLVEREVQARLFDRDHGGAAVTDPGRCFVEHAAQSLQAYHRAIHEAREAKRGERHTLRIGVSAYLPPTWIERLRAAELRLYRDVAIEIVTDYSLELLVLLQRRRIDLALVTTPPETSAVTTVRVTNNPFMIAFREGHPLAARKSVTLAEVSEYPWIFFNRSLHPYLHDLILQRTEDKHRKPDIVQHIMREEQITAFLRDDSLIAWLTAIDAECIAHQGLACIPLVDEHIRLEIHLAALADNKSSLVSEYVRTFVKRMDQQRPPEQLSLPTM